jgi:hypothetical protein
VIQLNEGSCSGHCTARILPAALQSLIPWPAAAGQGIRLRCRRGRCRSSLRSATAGCYYRLAGRATRSGSYKLTVLQTDTLVISTEDSAWGSSALAGYRLTVTALQLPRFQSVMYCYGIILLSFSPSLSLSLCLCLCLSLLLSLSLSLSLSVQVCS